MSLVSAIEALAERGVRVINLSLSGPANAVLQNAIAAARAEGIVIIATAGNNGAGAEPAYPAASPGVIAVTAVDQDLNISHTTQGACIDLTVLVKCLDGLGQGSSTLKQARPMQVPFICTTGLSACLQPAAQS